MLEPINRETAKTLDLRLRHRRIGSQHPIDILGIAASDDAVKPTRSQNKDVTTFRFSRDERAGAPSGAPHSAQNLFPSGLSGLATAAYAGRSSWAAPGGRQLPARCPEAGRLSYTESISACQRRRTAAVSHRTQWTTTKRIGNDASVSAGARKKSSAFSRVRSPLRWLKTLTRT